MLLARNCNVDLQTNEGYTALMCAAEKGHKDVVDALLAHNCSLDVQGKVGGETAVMLAALKGKKDIVDSILAYNCNVDLQSKLGGFTALMVAAQKDYKDVVDSILAHKCKLDLQNNNGETALMIAKSNNHFEVAALIENQLRRNRNWDHRKALMLVLTGSNYLPSSPSLLLSSSSSSSSAAVVDSGRVVHNPVVIQRVDTALTTSSEKVLCDLFLVQHIMRYI